MPFQAFTDLELKASHWEAKGKPRSGSTILHAQEVRQWHDWCSQAMRYRKEQLPTDLQLEYVRVSDAHHRSHKRLRAGVLGVAVVLIVIGTSVSIAMAMRASHLRLVAEEEAFKADRAMKLALLGEKAALQQRRIAEHEKRAVLVWNLLNAAGQPSRDSFMALKLLRQALAILPKDGRPDLAWACLDLYRRLLANDHGSIPCTGEVRLPNASAVLNILLDQSGSGLAITIPFYGGSTVSVWNISHAGSDTPVSVLKGGHPALLSFMVFGPPGSDLIATAGMDGSIALWRKVFEGWEVASVLRNHTGSIWALDVSRDGSMLASCQMGLPDTAIRIWHGWPGLSSSKEGVSTGRVTLLGGHADWVQSVAWRPDNSALASSSSDWTVRLWQVTPRGELVGSSVLHRGNTVLGLMAWHPDGSKLAVGGRDKSVTLIDMTDDTSRVLKLPSTITAGRLPAYLDWQAESPRAPMGGGLSVAISVLDNSIMLFPMTGDGYELPRVQLLSSEDRGAIEYISFSPDGEWMLAVRLVRLVFPPFDDS